MAPKSGAVVERGAKSVEYADVKLYEYYGAPKPDGVTEKSLAITLPRNAVVGKFEVVITAATAHAVTAGEAGQVRTTSGSGATTVVIDFGTLRTVSAVGAPDGTFIRTVSSWIGTEFGSTPKFASEGSSYATLSSEVRTERLQLVVSGSPSTEVLATGTVLVLPESPAGIEVRIDGAAPVFSHPAAVDPSDSTALSAQEWSSDSRRVVDLGPALAALTGNPLDESSVTFTATVTSRVPGVLDIELRSGGQDVRRVRRVSFNGQSSRDIVFEAEGTQTIAFDSLPNGLVVNDVRMTMSGTPPPVRVVPPIGPDVPVPAFATFVLTPNRAACIRVPADSRLAELSGVRIPLAADAAGGEARVVLWKSKDLVDLSPAEPLENGASEPLTLDGTDEQWRTFSWKKPIAFPPAYVLWAVLTINRGGATTVLADAAAGIGAERLLWGAPTGPWHDLPEALTSARARIRVVGKAKPDVPFPPLSIALAGTGASTSITVGPRGVAAALTGLAAPQSGVTSIVLTSHAAASVTLRDVDVVSTT